jgi:hypothetical protein
MKTTLLTWTAIASITLGAPLAKAATFPSTALPDGIGVNIGVKTLTTTDLQKMQELGVKYVRIDLKWKDVEVNRGSPYNWSKYDTLLSQLAQYNLKPVFLVVYGHNEYGTSDGITMNEADERQGYASFAAAAVARYEHQMPGIIWELWNEQNTSPFWGVAVDGDQNTPNAARERAINYMGFIDVVVPAMRAANSNCTIISGGVLDVDWNVTTAWFDEAFSRGLLSKVDGLGAHLYGGASNKYAERIGGEIANLRQRIVNNGGSANFPILNTEVGWQPTEFSGTTGLQEDERAATHVRMALLTRMYNVLMNVWYEWRTTGNMSILNNDYTEKPTATAIRVMGSELEGYTYHSRKNIGSSDDYALVFTNGSQRKLVLWTTDPIHKVSIPVQSGSSFATKSMLGASGSVGVTGGQFTISISDQPTYVNLGTVQLGSTLSETLPAMDIGAVGIPGTAGTRDGTYWIRASGSDIWGNSDQFRFVYKAVTGDTSLVARVLSLSNTNVDAKAGVMIRETLDPDSRHASMFITPSNKAQSYRRSTTGGATSMTNSSTASPHWLKIEREGNVLRGYRSSDGVNWGSPVNSVTLSNPAATMYVGLAVSARNNGQLASAVFDNVSQDLGGGFAPAVRFDPYQRIEAESFTAQNGVIRYGGGSYQKMGNIHNGDWLEFQRVDFGSGPLTFKARTASATNGGTIEVRVGSPTGTLLGSVVAPKTSTSNWETFTDIQTSVAGTTGVQDLYLVFTGGSGTLFDVDYFQFDPADATPPLVSEDIGNPIPGSATENNGVYTIQASGTDIWSNSDQFHFLHQSMTGDGEISVRVDSIGNTDANAKAGVMMRASTAANAAYAYTFVTPTNGRWFQRRSASGGYSGSVASTSGGAPTWVKLVRSSNTFTSYVSSNGTSWSQLSSPQTITMPSTIEVGLAVTSHNAGAVTTAVFSDLETP